MGWVCKIISACPDLSSSFTFFMGSLRIIIVAASSRGLVEVCASTTGNILGVVSCQHLFPYLTFLADFFPFLSWCFSIHSFHRWHRASNSTTAITLIMNTASMLHGPSPLMRVRVHHALPCWSRPIWAFFIIISCSINVITHCIYKNLMIFCLKSIVPHPDCLSELHAHIIMMSHASYPHHVVACGLPIMWFLSCLTDFCWEIGSRDWNQHIKRSQLALFSCHML